MPAASCARIAVILASSFLALGTCIAGPAAAAVAGGETTFVEPDGRPDAADVGCVDAALAAPGADRRAMQVVYAVPAGTPSRAASMVPRLRRAVLAAGAFVDEQARRDDSRRSAVLRVRCVGGAVDIPVVRLATAAGATTPASIRSEVLAGLLASGRGDADARFLVYVDADPPPGAPGGFVDRRDASDAGASPSAATNPNDLPGSVAVQFRVGGGPWWNVLLHEYLHGLGAVWPAGSGRTDVPPNATGSGHCSDGLDVLCSADGSTGGARYSASRCSDVQLDCGADDYFAPAPAPGSWPSRHWNIATDAPTWITVRTAAAAAPPAPANAHVARASSESAAIAWSAPAVPVDGYRVFRRWSGVDPASRLPVAPAWLAVGRLPGSATSFTDTGLEPGAYAWRVRVMAAGAWSAASNVAAGTIPQLGPPTRLRIVAAGPTTLRVTWRPPKDAGVVRYEVRHGVLGRFRLRMHVTRSTSIVLRGLLRASGYVVQVTAIDRAGHRSNVPAQGIGTTAR